MICVGFADVLADPDGHPVQFTEHVRELVLLKDRVFRPWLWLTAGASFVDRVPCDHEIEKLFTLFH